MGELSNPGRSLLPTRELGCGREAHLGPPSRVHVNNVGIENSSSGAGVACG